MSAVIAPIERRLFEQGRPILRIVAKRMARRMAFRMELDDLVSLGQTGLLDAARTHDESRSTFATYASLKIKWAILDGLRREERSRTMVARAAALAASERFGEAHAEQVDKSEEPQTEEVYQARLATLLKGHAAALAVGLVTAADLAPEPSETPEEEVVHADLLHALRRAVGTLPERERQLVERHYYGNEAFDAIASDLGISKSWASRIHAHAVEHLGSMLRDEPPEEPEPA